MRVAILGPLEVESAAVGGARLRWLLVRLALAAGRAVTVEELAADLWPEEPPAAPGNALQSLVSRLRRALPEAGALVSVPGGYRLEADTDAGEFDRLTARARQHGDPAVRAELLEQALRLWRGAALGEVAAAPFALGYATRLEEARLTAVEDRAEAELALLTRPEPREPPGGLAALASELGELAARHPLRERLHALRVQALHADGRRAEALAAYAECRRHLADQLGADPGAELREIHLAVLRSEPPRPPRTNLRAPLTSFVGRDAELARVRRQLRAGRLVTLVGPGGAGKTRLATTVAAELLGECGAVWLVELAPVTDPGDLPQAVLAALGNHSVIGHPIRPVDTTAALVEALSAGQVLLVLDNCEHLVEAAAHLAEELLGRCPALRVLTTSREPLGILGETLSPVPPLLPEPAVRLLAERAAAGNPGLSIEPAVAAEICRRLDGLPLAIELAAARLRTLTPRQLAARLDDRFLLLTGGSRTALPRHQTLRAVVAWSWDLLNGPERRLAERLAVFAGGFDLAAAEHVGGSLDLVAALVDKSIVQPADDGRYRMLETIREYGLERLAADGRIAAVRARHAAYFRDLAEHAEPRLRGRDQLAWIARLLADHDNILAALHHAVDSADAATAIRLAAAMGIFWTIRGTRAESAGWIGRALDVPGETPTRERLIASAVYIINASLDGGHTMVAPAARELRRAASLQDGEEAGHPVLAMLQPALALFTDDAELGFAVIERRLAHPDPWTRGMLYVTRAALKENGGDMAGSRADLLAGCAELRQAGERWGLSMALTSLAETHAVFGDFGQGLEAMDEAVRLLLELNPEADVAHQRVWQASILVRQGDVERARAVLRGLIDAPEGRETPARNVAFAQVELGHLARQEGDLRAAERYYAAAGHAMEDGTAIAPQFRALLLVGQAHLAVATHDHQAAARHAERAAELVTAAADMPVLARVAVAVAELRAARGDLLPGATALGAAEQLRGAPDAANPDVARVAARLRDDLGEEAFAAAFARGRALDRARAVELATGGPW
ncbi:BTAD domain-containing putative transcriptional regulator [Nonomuraea sp. NPDC003709]|uniref:BTAD domain-containing putative transcriptional regulator n=1 Tax=Nonomuraea sp. NPDC003709 TaxID=3154450 RepID=UPI0033B06C6F